MKIAADHPALAGHFPGNPVVPGVVLLDEVMAALEDRVGRPVRILGLPNVKFLAPVLPQEVVEIHFADKQPGTVAFTMVRGETTVASGSVVYENSETKP